MPKAPLLREKRARSTIDLVTLGLATLSIIYEAGIRETTVFDSRNRFQITVIGNQSEGNIATYRQILLLSSINNQTSNIINNPRNRVNKNAFQQDAYCSLADRIPQCPMYGGLPNLFLDADPLVMHAGGNYLNRENAKIVQKLNQKLVKSSESFFPLGNRSIFLRMLKSFQTKFNRLTSLKMRVGSQTSKVKLAD